MPPTQPRLSLVNFFSLEIDGKPIELVHQVSGLKWSYETVDFKAQNKTGRMVQAVNPGVCPRPAELTFKTFEINSKLPAWFDSVLQAGPAGKATGAIVLYDESLKPMGRYKLTNIWPSKLSWSTLTAGSSTPMELDVTIQVDSVDFMPA